MATSSSTVGAAVVERHQLVGVRGPQPGIHRRDDAPLAVRQGLGRQARCPGRPKPIEQAEFHAQVHEPGPVESGQAADQVVESVVGAHRPDCRM